ncbi:hypothetical protein DRN74_07150 [Candidatus Micrarchaeota archaeon]|nr:MAG: hypothetical protein DRN74_07150 [Candidatus Micrarchaeota archaeon]
MLGIKYRYEAEGFRLPHGPFLPDFLLYLLGKVKIWVEVKPPDFPEERLNRLEQLVDDLYEETGIMVLCIFGEPWPGEYTVAMVPFPFDGLVHRGLKDQEYVLHWGENMKENFGWLIGM